jgi:hypothetical protein
MSKNRRNLTPQKKAEIVRRYLKDKVPVSTLWPPVKVIGMAGRSTVQCSSVTKSPDSLKPSLLQCVGVTKET